MFIDDFASNGKTYLLQAICNDYSSFKNSTIYIPMQKAIILEPSILSGVSELDLVCIDDVDLMNKQREWEIALFNLINECYEKECHLLLSGSINKLEVMPDLTSRIKKMEILRLETIDDDELLEASKAISNNLNIEISDKNMNYLINNSKRDIKTVFKTLSKLEIEDYKVFSYDTEVEFEFDLNLLIQNKLPSQIQDLLNEISGLNLIKEVIQSF